MVCTNDDLFLAVVGIGVTLGLGMCVLYSEVERKLMRIAQTLKRIEQKLEGEQE